MSSNTNFSKSPRRGQVYSLAFLITELELQDSPCLGFEGPNGIRCVIQDSHLTESELLSNPAFSKTEWTYRRTTDEWIPVFDYKGDIRLLVPLLHIEVSRDPYENISSDVGSQESYSPHFWCTPKEFPREQYYHKTDDGFFVSSPHVDSQRFSYKIPEGFEAAEEMLVQWIKDNS